MTSLGGFRCDVGSNGWRFGPGDRRGVQCGVWNVSIRLCRRGVSAGALILVVNERRYDGLVQKRHGLGLYWERLAA